MSNHKKYSHNLIGKVEKDVAPTFWDWLGDNIWVIFLVVGLLIIVVVGAIVYERSNRERNNRSYALPLIIIFIIIITLIVIYS